LLSIKSTDGRLACNNLEKINPFAQHLERRFHQNSGLDTLPVLNSNDYLDKFPLVTPRQVAQIIRTNLVQKKKTHGFEPITGDIPKNFKRNSLVRLSTLMRQDDE
jgi:hypothetical protein